jgi:hypothetical protein
MERLHFPNSLGVLIKPCVVLHIQRQTWRWQKLQIETPSTNLRILSTSQAFTSTALVFVEGFSLMQSLF